MGIAEIRNTKELINIHISLLLFLIFFSFSLFFLSSNTLFLIFCPLPFWFSFHRHYFFLSFSLSPFYFFISPIYFLWSRPYPSSSVSSLFYHFCFSSYFSRFEFFSNFLLPTTVSPSQYHTGPPPSPVPHLFAHEAVPAGTMQPSSKDYLLHWSFEGNTLKETICKW